MLYINYSNSMLAEPMYIFMAKFDLHKEFIDTNSIKECSISEFIFNNYLQQFCEFCKIEYGFTVQL